MARIRLFVEPSWDGIRESSRQEGWEEIRVSWEGCVDCSISRLGRQGVWYDTYIYTRWEGYDSGYWDLLPEIVAVADLVRLHPEEIKAHDEEWLEARLDERLLNAMKPNEIIAAIQNANSLAEIQALSRAWLAKVESINQPEQGAHILFAGSSFVIDGIFVFSCNQRSNAPDEQDRREENRYNAMETVERCRVRIPAELYDKYKLYDVEGVTNWLCNLIAPHYDLDGMALYAAWLSHYGPGILFPATSDTRVQAAMDMGLVDANFPNWENEL